MSDGAYLGFHSLAPFLVQPAADSIACYTYAEVVISVWSNEN